AVLVSQSFPNPLYIQRFKSEWSAFFLCGRMVILFFPVTVARSGAHSPGIEQVIHDKLAVTFRQMPKGRHSSGTGRNQRLQLIRGKLVANIPERRKFQSVAPAVGTVTGRTVYRIKRVSFG